MSTRDPLTDLRDQFRAAAAREIAKEAPVTKPIWRRRPGLRALAAIMVLGAGTAGVATAVDLISVGAERRDVPERPARYAPQQGPAIALVAPDPGSELPWGVADYTSPDGKSCAIAGHVRGSALGVIEAGVFRPYAPDTAGACGDIEDGRFFIDIRSFDGRTLVYGRARRDVAEVEVIHDDGQVDRAATGRGGAYLLVFDAGLQEAGLQLIPRAADGAEAPVELGSGTDRG